MLTVEQCKSYHWTVEEARGFMASWWRVAECDKSTVAYAPDEATARAIAQVPAMVETLTELEACFEDGKGHLETRLYAVREKARAILRAVEGQP